MNEYDIVIVGAGMAGASLAAFLAPHARVLVLEMEDRPGVHATGRSAAFWAESYGGPEVQPLTTASRAFLSSPPPEISHVGFLKPRGALYLGEANDLARSDAMAADYRAAGVAIERLSRAGLEERVPDLDPRWTTGVWEPGCHDIDVARLHAGFLSATRKAGGEIRSRAGLDGALWVGQQWHIQTRTGEITAPLLVNAAGAWADDVAARAGIGRIGIRPYRRTIAQVRMERPVAADLPLVLGLDESFYFKPDVGGRLWLSPHDETAVEAGDAAAEEIDVARAIARLTDVIANPVVAVERSWAGLRSFAPDRLPVIGRDPRHAGFFWFAGQGGFGIQTAPAAAMLAASMLTGHVADAAIAAIDPSRYDPARFS